jgi:hypothetical protein
MDFEQSDQTNSPWVRYYWTGGTVVSSAVMGISMVWVVIEVFHPVCKLLQFDSLTRL